MKGKLLASVKWFEAGKLHRWEIRKSENRYWESVTVGGIMKTQEVTEEDAKQLIAEAEAYNTGIEIPGYVRIDENGKVYHERLIEE